MIKVDGITFKEAAIALLDAGFTFEKIDSNFLTIRTDFKNGTADNKWMKLRLLIREKESSIIITGEWYNTMFGDNSSLKIENTLGNSKRCFKEMNIFALSFKKPVEYLIN